MDGEEERTDSAEVVQTDESLEALLLYMQRSRGFDFTGYKRTTLSRRIARRMQLVGVGSCAEYLDYLEVHPDEFPQLFNTLLINVTSFFRDVEPWVAVSEHARALIGRKRPIDPIRVWSAGCASGEEPY